jgi:DNA-binding NarL/FixJ family response regulator
LADPAAPILIEVTHTKFPIKTSQEAVRAADRKSRAKVLANFANLDAPDTISTVIAIIAYISIYSIHYDMSYKRYNSLTNDTIEILLKCGRSVVEIAKTTHVAETTVRRKKRLFHMFGTVNPVSLAV